MRPALLERVKENAVRLQDAHKELSEQARSEYKNGYAAEWFLDNYYLVRQAVSQALKDLPPNYYRELPVDGAVPRVYGLAQEVLARCDDALDFAVLGIVLREQQQGAPLRIGELWAVPAFLRLALVEDLTSRLQRVMAGDGGAVSDEEGVANCIASLRAVERHDWKEFFEEHSLVEEALRGDACGAYVLMDFPTRDRYRKVIERLAASSQSSEVEVAHSAVALTAEARSARAGEATVGQRKREHVGYYLLSDGLEELSARVHYRPNWRERTARFVYRHPTFIYLTSVLAITLLLLLGALLHVRAGGGGASMRWLATLIGLVPALGIGVALVNLLVSRFLPPRLLPKMDFSGGVPREFRTAVIIPAMLASAEGVDDLVRQLERHYLGNRDEELLFVLLTDFVDASEQLTERDTLLLQRAQAGVQELNRRHGAAEGERFYILNRERRYNPAEGVWMGWERKRGKLVEFNKLLRGAADTSYAYQSGELGRLAGARFVLTLDADTRLPPGGAHRLIGTLAHPLNRAEFDDQGHVIAGYSILQPRTEVLPESANATYFSRLFVGDNGLDLYTLAVSDVYQDLFGAGIYVGKGLYDLDDFARALKGRVPENRVLSHDLLEGIYGGVGLVTDVVLYEEYPPTYMAQVLRMQRWIRGDWQLLPYLAASVAGRGAGLGAIGSWKLFDNLRRSLLMPTVVAMLLLAYTVLPGSPLLWTLMALGGLAVPLTANAALAVVNAYLHRGDAAGEWRTMVPWRPLGDAVRRLLITTAFSMFEAVVALRSALTALVRVFITRKKLLEWRTAAQAERSVTDLTLLGTTVQMASALLISAAGLVLMILLKPAAALVAWPVFALWFSAPLIAHGISRSLVAEPQALSEGEQLMLRTLARRTWHYFEQFVGPSDNWLPPDNVQLGAREITAHRTSPTNIGLMLHSTLAAYDLGYLGPIDLSVRLTETITTLSHLQRYRGHLLNWYDTRTLQPLTPRYVSSVDSGNLVACLIELREGCFELLGAPVESASRWEGLRDTVQVLHETAQRVAPTSRIYSSLTEVRSRVLAASDPGSWPALLDYLQNEALPGIRTELMDLISAQHVAPDELADVRSWVERVRFNVNSTQREYDFLLPWNRALRTTEEWEAELGPASAAALARVRDYFAAAGTPSLRDLEQCALDGAQFVREFAEALTAEGATGALGWARALEGGLRSAARAATGLNSSLEEAAQAAGEEIENTDFGFLFDDERDLLHIGYNVDSEALDANYYDLLASEARLASLVGIAKGDLPVRHWLHLGRPLTDVGGRATLLSWSGTMFEYLMPNLLTRRFGGTLLEQACDSAVSSQLAYAHKQGVPFGISESGYARTDGSGIYQYRAFGVPSLALDRGQEADLVITPYASVLALAYRPREVVANLRTLKELGALGPYGFYEALDYTPTRQPLQRPFALVESHMAHHQGMILGALANVITDGAAVRRFHADPRVSTVELLLQERIPAHVPVAERREGAEPRPDPGATPPNMQPWHPAPAGAVPEAHLLSNGHYTVLITAAGAGESRFEETAITRYHADPTHEDAGTFIYLHDEDEGDLWSITERPLGAGEAGAVEFSPHAVDFSRQAHGIYGHLEVTVADQNAELRRVTLVNQEGRERRVRLTSYAEVVLGDRAGDQRHPAFSKLFVESSFEPDGGALIFRRRPRSAEELPLHAAHFMIMEGADGVTASPVTYESDRLKFLGRGRDASDPAGARDGLSGTVGATLDPVMALSRTLTLAPHAQVTCTFVTAYGASPAELQEVVSRLSRHGGVARAFEVALERSRRELAQLHATRGEPRLFQRLLSALLLPTGALRAPSTVLAENYLGQSGLWGQGISGDYPLLLLRVGEAEDLDLVADVVRAHGHWRRRGVKVDIVILNSKESGYSQELQGRLRWLLSRTGGDDWLNARGGIYLIREDQLAKPDRTLLLSAARVILDASLPLDEQLSALDAEPSELPPLQPLPGRIPSPTAVEGLQRSGAQGVSNGWGRFSSDGREYVIELPGWSLPPAPWSNVIANEEVGFLATEAGMGSSWYLNSGENRLTSWRNDPVSDPPAEVVYLRDEETAEVWSATPLPSNLGTPFEVRHGPGHTSWKHTKNGLTLDLEATVAAAAPVKLMRLRVKDESGRARRLTITYYADLVLGVDTATTRMFVVPAYDAEHGALLASNKYNAEFGEQVVFVAANKALHGVTADRREFLGRSGSLREPAALRRVGLSGNVQAGVDPCVALQLHVDLGPGEEEELLFVLGAASSEEEAFALIENYREVQQYAAHRAANAERWSGLLEQLQVDTPDPALNLLVNGWLNYQTVSARLFGRTAFYQSSGAYGFRDQLQDVMSIMHSAPELAREQLLRAAAHQFEEGDVLHWWHPPSGRGVRTKISDDLLWLPYVTAHYVEVTGDDDVLAEMVPFLTGPGLVGDEHERYDHYQRGASGSLLEHCLRALRKGATRGERGLALMGGGDWNDGMNRVGVSGRGESVWLTWFLMVTLKSFASLLRQLSRDDEATWLEERWEEYRAAAEESAWDGDWYLRAFFDDGAPLGSKASEECRIDSVAQSWSLMALGDHERGRRAMKAVDEQLVREEDGLIRLFTPAFDKSTKDPGYVKGYLPGVRENGGQYTHGAIWVAWAFTLMGDGERALELFRLLAPVTHGATREAVERYKVEPYVVAADVYSLPPHVGRGGWTWYTGSAAWLYRLAVEQILGIRKVGDCLEFAPCLHPGWEGYRATWRHGDTTYKIRVRNASGVLEDARQRQQRAAGVNVAEPVPSVLRIVVDGRELPGKRLPLEVGGSEHEVIVELA